MIPPPRKPFTQLLPGSGPLTQIMGKMLPLAPRVIVNSIVKPVERFNSYVRGERSDAFGRTGDQVPMAGDRWILLGPVKAYFTTTEGGAAVNEQLQVLDAAGRPIDGLYAVGQNGLGGQILWGHGLHIAWALTSGRLVGQRLGSTA